MVMAAPPLLAVGVTVTRAALLGTATRYVPVSKVNVGRSVAVTAGVPWATVIPVSVVLPAVAGGILYE